MTRKQRQWALWLLCVAIFLTVEALIMDRIPAWFRWLQIEVLLLAYVFKGLWIPYDDSQEHHARGNKNARIGKDL